MIGNSIDHLGFAGAANPLGTGERNVDPGVEQYVENGLARRHCNRAAAAMELNLETTDLSRNRIVCHVAFPAGSESYSA